MIKVYIEEEYGYRNWLWDTGMSSDELISYWEGIDTMNKFFFSGPTSLPGEVREIYIEAKTEDLGNGFSAILPREEGSIEYYNISGDEIVGKEKTLKNYWFAHVHLDFDSWLKTDSGIKVLHAGFVPEEEYYKDDWTPSDVAKAATIEAIERQITRMRACTE